MQNNDKTSLIENIATALGNGEDVSQVVKDYSTNISTVRAVAKLYEIPLPKTSKGRPAAEYPVEDWVNAYNEGSSIKEISDNYNCSYATVRKYLSENGVKFSLGRPSTMDSFDKEEVQELYCNQGLTLQVVATKVGTSILTLRKFMLKEEIPLRSPGARKKEKEEVPKVVPTQQHDDLAEDPMEMLELLTVKELRELCEKAGVEVNGTKTEMCDRLRMVKSSNG